MIPQQKVFVFKENLLDIFKLGLQILLDYIKISTSFYNLTLEFIIVFKSQKFGATGSIATTI